MATPSRPTLILARTSLSSFTATVTGDLGVTHTLWYRESNQGPGNDVEGPSRIGDGTLNVTDLPAGFAWLVYDVCDDGGFLSLPAITTIALTASDSILGAIQRTWAANPALTDVAGRLFAEEVPESLNGELVVLPYTVISLDRTFTSWTFEQVYYEMTPIEFTLFGTSLSVIEDAHDIVRQLFAWQYLTFVEPNTNATVYMQPVDYRTAPTGARNRDGRPVFRGCLTYEALTERHLP